MLRNKVLPEFARAAERAASGEPDPWPNSMRVRKMRGTEAIWEMTWSWRNPAGRATWQWIEIDGQAGVRWRRVGGHDVLNAA
jgi:hypothetical protein